LSRLEPATKFGHPHLVHVFDAGYCELEGTSVVYVVMEYAEEDLSQILPQRALAPSEVSDMLVPLLDGLAYLHARGYVHGHIKPSNVLAVQDQLKLSVDQITEATDTNLPRRRMGMYDAPEILSGIATPESDVWSIGVTIVAALTQSVPGAGPTEADPNIAETIPEPFRAISRECLHIDPKQRCTLAELQARLQPGGRPEPAPSQITSVTPIPVDPVDEERGKWRFVIPLAAVLVLAVAGAIWHWGSPSEAPGKSENIPARQSPVQQSQEAPVTAPSEPSKSEPAKNPSTESSANGSVKHQVLPDLSRGSRSTISGTIKVTVSVEADSAGKVTDAHLKSSGPSRFFAGKALLAAREWEFTPPAPDGKPSPSSWLLQFRFKRSGTQASAQQVPR
jgi:TonB family protein